jgi:hypothetical protein
MYEDMERVRIGATIHHDSSIVAIFLEEFIADETRARHCKR